MEVYCTKVEHWTISAYIKQAVLRLIDSTTLLLSARMHLDTIHHVLHVRDAMCSCKECKFAQSYILSRMNSHLCLVAQPWSTAQGYVSHSEAIHWHWISHNLLKSKCLVRFNHKRIIHVHHQALLFRTYFHEILRLLSCTGSILLYHRRYWFFICAACTPVTNFCFILNQSVSNKRFY